MYLSEIWHVFSHPDTLCPSLMILLGTLSGIQIGPWSMVHSLSPLCFFLSMLFLTLYIQNVFLTVVNPIYHRFAFFTSLTSFLVLKVLACNLYSSLHNQQVSFFRPFLVFSECDLYFYNKRGLFCSWCGLERQWSVTHSHSYPQWFGLMRAGNLLEK